MPFCLEYQKEKENMIVNILTRIEDITEEQESRKIFLQAISLEKAKEQEYHLVMEIFEVKKQNNDKQEYRGKKIVEKEEGKEYLIKRYHDDSRMEYSGEKEILRKVADIMF